MRLWSIHPQYLDSKGLIALWRESLLALAVLEEKTKGYKNHPQLIRFKRCKDPVSAILEYLQEIRKEGINRGYNFKEVNSPKIKQKINVTDGQIKHEVLHLLKKLEKRDKKRFANLKKVTMIKSHPQFKITKGDVEDWEKIYDKNIAQ